jgi:hypothetical protein
MEDIQIRVDANNAFAQMDMGEIDVNGHKSQKVGERMNRK